MSFTINDVPVTSLEILKALAAEAPLPLESSKQPIKRSQGRGRPRKQELGPLQVEKYLQQYGVEYTIKAGTGKTIYKLHRCLFDPSHTKNEASIVQDSSGKLTYQCF